MSTYVVPGQIVATGSVEPATVVAFDPGVCRGVDMYEAFEVYFPQYGQTFNPSSGYRNLCSGTNVTG